MVDKIIHIRVDCYQVILFIDEAPMSYRILLVDDDTTSAQLVRVLCDRAAYHLTVTADGKQALELLNVQPFDLILIDVKLPGRDAIETAKGIQSEIRTAHIPIIFITAMAYPHQVAELSVLRPAGVVIKPFSPKGLLGLIQLTLEHPDDSHTVIMSPTKTVGDGLDHQPRLRLIEEPGRVSGQQQELFARVPIGGSDAGRQLGGRKSRSAGADVTPLLEAHQAGLRNPNKPGSSSLAQVLRFP